MNATINNDIPDNVKIDLINTESAVLSMGAEIDKLSPDESIAITIMGELFHVYPSHFDVSVGELIKESYDRQSESHLVQYLKNKYDARVKIIKAMAHSTRLFMIDELSKKEKCVCELQKLIGDDFSTVSKHLTILKNAGLVLNNKRGKQVFYKIDASCANKIICCADNVIKSKLKKETLISNFK